ncbi:hypothetical protein AAKU64_004404 [Undibacterium sp. GrIS 1.8]
MKQGAGDGSDPAAIHLRDIIKSETWELVLE